MKTRATIPNSDYHGEIKTASNLNALKTTIPPPNMLNFTNALISDAPISQHPALYNGGNQMATLMERVQEIVADKLSVDESEVVADASFMEDLNADSLDLVELIMAFEEEFSDDDVSIEISDEDAENITTVQQAIDYLKANGVADD